MISDAEFEKRIERHIAAALAEKKGRPVTKGDSYYGGRIGAMSDEDRRTLFDRFAGRGLWADAGKFLGDWWMTLKRKSECGTRNAE